MSANVETMMSVRETPWHGLGTIVQDAPTSADALHLAGLDWEVIPRPIQLCGGAKIEGWKANVRDKDKEVLGIVSDKYSICQNKDAFDFTDNLIDSGDVRYETAGSLNKGRKIWLLAKMPTTSVLGDEVEPYLCFSNTHDGTGAIKVCMTPVRVVCNNTLNLALRTAKRAWSAKHMGNIDSKLKEARDCLRMANSYIDGLSDSAEEYAKKKITDEQIAEILDELFPRSKDASPREIKNIGKMKDNFMVCYYMPDIAKFRGTAWGAINAMADMVDHAEPIRNTKNYRENNWNRIMDGHVLLDKMVALCDKVA